MAVSMSTWPLLTITSSGPSVRYSGTIASSVHFSGFKGCFKGAYRSLGQNDVETQFDTRCVMFSRSQAPNKIHLIVATSIAYDIPSTIALQSTCFNENAFESVRSPILSNISPIPFFRRSEGQNMAPLHEATGADIIYSQHYDLPS